MTDRTIVKFMHNGIAYIPDGGGGAPVAGVYGDGSDGDCVISKDTFLEAKEYNFDNLTICSGATLRFLGEGVPVVRVKNQLLIDGEINTRNPMLSTNTTWSDPLYRFDLQNKSNNYSACANTVYTKLQGMWDELESKLKRGVIEGIQSKGGSVTAWAERQPSAGGGGGVAGGSGSCGECGGAAGGNSSFSNAGGGGGGGIGWRGCPSGQVPGLIAPTAGQAAPEDGVGGKGGDGGRPRYFSNVELYACTGGGGGGGFGYCRGGEGGRGGWCNGMAGVTNKSYGIGDSGDGGNSVIGPGGKGGDIGCACIDGYGYDNCYRAYGNAGNGGCSIHGVGGQGGYGGGIGGCSLCNFGGRGGDAVKGKNGGKGGGSVYCDGGVGGCGYYEWNNTYANTEGGEGGDSIYGNGGKGGNTCCRVPGKGGDSMFGNGGDGGCQLTGACGSGGNSIYGNGCRNGYGMNGGESGNARNGTYGIGIFANKTCLNGNIIACGGTGARGSNGGDVLLVYSDLTQSGDICVQGGIGTSASGQNGTYTCCQVLNPL